MEDDAEVEVGAFTIGPANGAICQGFGIRLG